MKRNYQEWDWELVSASDSFLLFFSLSVFPSFFDNSITAHVWTFHLPSAREIRSYWTKQLYYYSLTTGHVRSKMSWAVRRNKEWWSWYLMMSCLSLFFPIASIPFSLLRWFSSEFCFLPSFNLITDRKVIHTQLNLSQRSHLTLCRRNHLVSFLRHKPMHGWTSKGSSIKRAQEEEERVTKVERPEFFDQKDSFDLFFLMQVLFLF